jgi:hypothetical protein
MSFDFLRQPIHDFMKTQMNESPVWSKMKRTPTAFLGAIFVALIGCFAFGAQAAVQVTRFDPPLPISAYAEPSGDSYFDVLAADLDADGVLDFRLAYACGDISAFFNVPTRFAQRVSQPNVEAKWGPVAGVPLDSTIGSNIVSSIATNFYAWSSGYSNKFDDLTASLGDNQTTVITANLVTYGGVPPGLIVTIDTNGFTTNIIYPHPTISGDVAFKDAVMALEFYIEGQRHYGYIHFNFNGGAAGVIYGWAYETEPNTAIVAASLAPASIPPIDTQPKVNSGIVGLIEHGNLPAWTVMISSPRGGFSTNVQTDDGGFFEANLQPGRYVLRPFHGPAIEPAQATPNNSSVGAAKSVVVRRNHFTFVTLPTLGKASDSPAH